MGTFGSPSFWEIFMNAQIRSSEIATATGSGAQTATIAAPAGGQSVYVTSISGGYVSANPRKKLELKSGSNVLATFFISDHDTIVFTSPVKIPPGTSAQATLESGTGNGFVNISGYTV